MDDTAEVQRLEKAFSKCRTCDHIMMNHSFLGKKKGLCLDVRLTNKEQLERCPCIIFIPKDNLEFLEWAAENKAKEK